MSPQSRQYERYKKSRTGAEMPRLHGELLATAISAGDFLASNPRKRVMVLVNTHADVSALRNWFRIYYPKSFSRLDVRLAP